MPTETIEGGPNEQVDALSTLIRAILQNASGQTEVNELIVNRLLLIEEQVKTLSGLPWTILKEEVDELRRRVDAHSNALERKEASGGSGLWVGDPTQESSMLRSQLCTEEQFRTSWHRKWIGKLGLTPRLHRKAWELCYIPQAFHERSMLGPGKRGLGFAVGSEPLPALFARLGCSILATDQERDAAETSGWVATNQHADSLASLNRSGICPSEDFERLVCFLPVDMNQIPPGLTGFDFLWSCCSFEHLGSIELGKRFVVNAMECLRPGGIAVHTTEFNVSSNTDTVDHSGTVIYRRQDIQALADELTSLGHEVAPLDFNSGKGFADHYVDLPPYKQDIHLKLELAGYVTTSIGLIIRKGE